MLKYRFLNWGLAIALWGTSVINTPVAGAAEWQQIVKRGRIIVAVKDNLRPLGFLDESGNLAGLEIDIARRLATELFNDQDAVEFYPVTNQERLQVILNDQVDIAIARVANTTPRNRIVDFSPHYYLDGTSLVTKKELNLNSLASLTRSTIAVLKKSATIAVIRHQLPEANLVGVDSYQEALSLLEAGTAQAFAADRTVLTGWTQEYPQYQLLNERLSASALCIVMPKGLQHQDLRLKIQQAIARWRESGWLEERIEYWGLPN